MVKNMISLHTFNNMMDGGYQIVRLEQRNNSTLVYRIIWFRITIYCEMEFQKFPFDEQSCTLEVISTRFPIPVTNYQHWHHNKNAYYYLLSIDKICFKNDKKNHQTYNYKDFYPKNFLWEHI